MARTPPSEIPETQITTPAISGHVVTPSDSVDLPHLSRGINVAVAGTVKYNPAGGTSNASDATVTLFLVAGVIHPVAASRIYATGTTATGIVTVW